MFLRNTNTNGCHEVDNSLCFDNTLFSWSDKSNRVLIFHLGFNTFDCIAW